MGSESYRVRIDALPAHVAIIMDGNGRWAKRLHEQRTFGHRKGSDAVRKTVRACRRLGIDSLTLFAFSEQNWTRPNEEVSILMELLEEFLWSEKDHARSNGVRFRAIGDVSRLPQQLQHALAVVEAETAEQTGMTLSIAVSYGGREEMVAAARRLVAMARAGKIEEHEVDTRAFERLLPSMDVGPVDLLIRTGGEQRTSNFLLWACAYAELYFCKTLWPDFEERDLYQAIHSYQERDRRFGDISSQRIAERSGQADERVDLATGIKQATCRT